jgi:hypothetical protein
VNGVEEEQGVAAEWGSEEEDLGRSVENPVVEEKGEAVGLARPPLLH